MNTETSALLALEVRPRLADNTARSGFGPWNGRGRLVTPPLCRSRMLRQHDVIRQVIDSACEEVADHRRDLLCMGLECEVACIEEMDYGTWNIAPERLSTARQKKGIVLSPHR